MLGNKVIVSFVNVLLMYKLQKSAWVLSIPLGEFSQTESIHLIGSQVKTQNIASTLKLPHSFPASYPQHRQPLFSLLTPEIAFACC